MRRTVYFGSKVYSEIASSGTYAIWKWIGSTYVLQYVTLDEYDHPPLYTLVDFRVSQKDWDAWNMKIIEETNK